MTDKFDKFKEELVISKDSKGKYHDALRKHVSGLLDISRKEMTKNYSTWDYHDQIFRSRRVLDKEDRSANAKGQPAKLIVPLTFSQIMTFVSFCVMNVTQNKRFFELQFEGNHVPEELREPMELVLERDCRRNTWSAFLTQFFLDVARFWIGAAEVCYKEEVRYIRIEQEVAEQGAFGVAIKTKTVDFQPVPIFIGNKIYPISPYRIFPDTRLPITRFQEGEFCGSEDMFSMATLRSDSDNLFNLDFIPRMSEKDFNERRKNSRIDVLDFMPTRSQDTGDGESNDNEAMTKSGAVVISKIVFDLIPANFQIDDEKVLGDEKFPVRYICWYANDRTIIRFEEAQYLHGKFPYVIAQYLPDQHKTINEGLSATCDQITNLITWKLNMHLSSQKNALDSKWIIDPAGVDIKSLESRSPYIFLKKNASQTGVDRYIKQFVTQDVTAGVMPDIASLRELLEVITGISSQMQGQYSEGRRSATQDRVVAQGAAARVKATLAGIWDQAFGDLGHQMLTNNRQDMDIETFVRIVGPGPFGSMTQLDGTLGMPLEELFLLFKSDPMSLARNEDFFVFDSSQPSEKAFLAQSLQEIFTTIVTNPAIAGVLGYGPDQLRYLFNEIYELRGVTPPSMPAPQQPPPMQGNVVPMQPGGAQPQLTAGGAASPSPS